MKKSRRKWNIPAAIAVGTLFFYGCLTACAAVQAAEYTLQTTEKRMETELPEKTEKEQEEKSKNDPQEEETKLPKLSIRYMPEPVYIDEKAYFAEDPDIVLFAEADEGIAGIEYCAGEETYSVLTGEQNADGVCEIHLNECDAFAEKLTDMGSGKYSWRFRVTDMFGETAEERAEFFIDKTAPDTEVFVSYHSDGANPGMLSSTGIMDFVRAVTDRLFGKTKVEFDLYVRDGLVPGHDPEEASGIDPEDLLQRVVSENGTAALENIRKAEDGPVSFIYNGTVREGYTKITGSLSLSEKDRKNGADRLCITGLKDRVGNTAGNSYAENITGATVLYFDRTNPVLTVDIGNCTVDQQNRTLFFCKDAVIGLSLAEENYENYVDENGEPIKPLICISGSEHSEAVLEEWRREESKIHTSLRFPAPSEEGEEAYDFTVAYQDGAGNCLEVDGAESGNVEDGIYRGYTVVTDNRAPELKEFSVHGVSGGRINDADIYQNKEGADVTISFTVDDHASYWNPEEMELVITNCETKEQIVTVNGTELQWTAEGRNHSAVYAFDGESDTGTFCYEAALSYADRAGNRLKAEGELDGTWSDGTFTGRRFILDHEAPEFRLSFNRAERLVKDGDTDSVQDRMESVPTAGYTAYYRGDIQVQFSVREQCAVPLYEGTELAGPADFHLTVTGAGDAACRPQVQWKKEGDVYEGSFLLTEEDRYRIVMSYKDPAGNAMTSVETDGNRQEEAASQEGKYESVLLVLDKTAPVVQISCVDEAHRPKDADRVFEENSCTFFSDSIYLKLEVQDENLRLHELLSVLEGAMASDGTEDRIMDNSLQRFLNNMDRTRVESGMFVWYLPLTTEAVWKIPVGCEDLSGNLCRCEWKHIVVDRTEPELQMSYSVEKTGFLDAVRYKDICYLFADRRITLTASARDAVSGIRRICFTAAGDGEAAVEKEIVFDPVKDGIYKTSIPFHGDDFKGIVTTEVWDWSGNRTVQRTGHIAESRQKHEDTKKLQIVTETVPGRTAGGIDYYNTDVKFRLTVEDTCSGLGSVICTGGTDINYQKDYVWEKKGLPEEKYGEEIVYGYSEEMMLNAAVNNENGVPVRAEYRDNAGHVEVLEQLYYIDITPPVIEVEYDPGVFSENGFYHQDRTATVTIQERNFDPADVEFMITSTEGILPLIGDWTVSGAGDETCHTCQVRFHEDGDYTFSLAFTDLAGNRAEYNRVDEFTIDQTAPVVTVSYDQNQRGSGNYYAEKRTAVIDILEHNFDASLFEITAEEKGEASVPLLSGWNHQGDHHTATVSFAEDGEYTFGIAGTDQAGNEMALYETEHFVIDQTVPRLEISKVKNQSANNGMIAPEIRCTDLNYDMGSMDIVLEGYLRGQLIPAGEMRQIENGEYFRMEDFLYEPEADDLYRLTVSARDLAGNESREEILFSVNRFGSVYTLEEKTELLAGARGIYYTNEEQDIIVTETNVDSLEFQEITCSLNGKLRTLKEGIDYEIQEGGSDESWKQYVYTIPRRNFRQEGTYILMIYSEDRAMNSSDNRTKGKKIEFVIDKTSPSILLSGLEDGGAYREHSREVTLDIEDNIQTAEVEVTVNGIVSTYYASEVMEKNGRITFMAGSSHRWQSLKVTAYDAAGNRQELKKIKFLITANPFIQFFMNKKLFYGSMGSLVLIWAGVWYLLSMKYRKAAQ